MTAPPEKPPAPEGKSSLLSEEQIAKVKRQMMLEGFAAIIVGEYRFSGIRYVRETGRTYWFKKYGVTIGIPKKMMKGRMTEEELASAGSTNE